MKPQRGKPTAVAAASAEFLPARKSPADKFEHSGKEAFCLQSRSSCLTAALGAIYVMLTVAFSAELHVLVLEAVF